MAAPPIFPTLSGYQRAWLGPDVLAGLTLVAIAVPEQIATARLASMPAVAGLFAFVAGSLVFAVLGRSRQLSVGADSTIAAVFATGVAAVATVDTPGYADLVSFLALMVGALLIAVGLLRLGWISQFLSIPVITGVLAGIGAEIVVRQLPAVLGLPGGGGTTVGRVRQLATQIDDINGWSLGIGVGVLAVVLLAERVDRRIPGALIALVGSILVVAVAGAEAHGIQVLGPIESGMPALGIPTASAADVRLLFVPALTVAFICVAQTAATLRACSDGVPEAADFNRDLVAIGAGNVLAGVSGSFPVNSSPPRTAVVTASGGRSQISGLTAAAVVLAVALVATGLLKNLPQATLGAILIFISTRLFRVRDLRSILRFDRLEFALAVITLIAVVALGIEQAVVVAMVLSLADRTRRAARPADVVLGRVPGTAHWIPPNVGRPTEQVPGVMVYLIYAPIWYGNADYVRSRVRRIVESAAPPTRALVLDANGISDIDYTGAKALGDLAVELDESGVRVVIARSSHLVQHGVEHSGLRNRFGPDRLFATVEEAVRAVAGGG